MEDSRVKQDTNTETIRELQLRLEGLELDLELEHVQSDDESVDSDKKHVCMCADSLGTQ